MNDSFSEYIANDTKPDFFDLEVAEFEIDYDPSDNDDIEKDLIEAEFIEGIVDNEIFDDDLGLEDLILILDSDPSKQSSDPSLAD